MGIMSVLPATKRENIKPEGGKSGEGGPNEGRNVCARALGRGVL